MQAGVAELRPTKATEEVCSESREVEFLEQAEVEVVPALCWEEGHLASAMVEELSLDSMLVEEDGSDWALLHQGELAEAVPVLQSQVMV